MERRFHIPTYDELRPRLNIQLIRKKTNNQSFEQVCRMCSKWCVSFQTKTSGWKKDARPNRPNT